MYDSDKRKLLSLVCHGAIFFSTLLFSIGAPIAVLLVSDDPVVKENATEAINFHLNVWFYSIRNWGVNSRHFRSGWLYFSANRLSGTLGTDNNGYPPGFAKS